MNRVIGFDCVTPPSEYVNVPWLPSVNVRLAAPTGREHDLPRIEREPGRTGRLNQRAGIRRARNR
jgi:hypothetical protein